MGCKGDVRDAKCAHADQIPGSEANSDSPVSANSTAFSPSQGAALTGTEHRHYHFPFEHHFGTSSMDRFPSPSWPLFAHIHRSRQMAAARCPALFALFTAQQRPLAFASINQTSIGSVFRKLIEAVRTILPAAQFGVFQASLRRMDVASRINECIYQILDYLVTFLASSRSFFNDGLQQYQLLSGQFHQTASPFLAFFHIQNSFPQIERHVTSCTNAIDTLTSLVGTLEDICQTYVIDEVVARNGAVEQLRVQIGDTLRSAQQYLFRQEILRAQYQNLVVHSFMRVWLNV